jgi:glucokinase
MFLGIEIGGTKLQLGVGPGDGTLAALERFAVEPRQGAEGILAQLEAAGRELVSRYAPSAVGFGFGGPVDTVRGIVVKSHHVGGWDRYPLADWCGRTLGLPAVLENDCDAACLAEARSGAGRGHKVVFYVTVGTGIGGGLAVDGQIYRGSGHGAAEIGHLRPGLHADRPEVTVESLASGWGIAAAARTRLSESTATPDAVDLLGRCDGQLDLLTAQMVSQAAAAGNATATAVLAGANQALGWAIAQALTLVSANVVVVGGGVSLMDERLFLAPLRAQVERYVFPPLLGKYEIVPAALGEAVVVHGALAAATNHSRIRSPGK